MALHLLVITHGMWGNPNHVGELERVVKEQHPGDELHVLRPQTSREENTYDGIDWNGERVVTEIVDEIASLAVQGRTVTRFSITGYSLGGLVARYVVGILRQRNFFDNITPVNFNTIATPHLGVPRMPSSFFSSMAGVIGPRMLSRTGEQFFCADKWLKGRPLLEVMADPDQIFYQGLAAFQTIRIYANAVNDTTVPYVTAAIEVHDPFVSREATGLEIEIDEKYSPRVASVRLPDVPPTPTPKPTVLSPKWFKSLTNIKRPPLPPFLQFRFPFNYVVYLMIPILFPTFITLALFRITVASRGSRLRIRLLEEEAATPGSVERLAHVLAKLETQVESAVLDLVEETESTPGNDTKNQPYLKPVQRRIAANLNKLPLIKEIAYFPTIRFAHAVIVCRDVKNFESHKAGVGIVKHWANSFIL